MSAAVDPVEVTVKHVATVDSLPAAWAFVMERLDRLAGAPTIEIRPISRRLASDSPDQETQHFSVQVSAMTEESADGGGFNV